MQSNRLFKESLIFCTYLLLDSVQIKRDFGLIFNSKLTAVSDFGSLKISKDSGFDSETAS